MLEKSHFSLVEAVAGFQTSNIELLFDIAANFTIFNETFLPFIPVKVVAGSASLSICSTSYYCY
jgi:hypothetical protein